MDFGDLLKRSWEMFIGKIVPLLIFFVVGAVLSMTIVLIPTVMRGMVKGMLGVVKEDKEPELSLLWDFSGYLNMLILLVIYGIAVMIGSILLLLPALFITIIWMYPFHFMVDKDMGAIDAIKASQSLVFSNFGGHIVVWLIAGVLMAVGSAVAVGTLLTGPLALIFMTLVYVESQQS